MRSARGVTLIELMITVALLGISATAAGVTATRLRAESRIAVQQEQATLLLDYHAALLSGGRPVDEGIADRLAAPLPERSLSREDLGATSTLTLRWRDPFGRQATRALTVFVGPAP